MTTLRTRIGPQTAAGADQDEFLIASGGPFLAAHERARLVPPGALRPLHRAFLYVAVAWLPLVVLSLIDGTAFEPGNGRGLLVDLRPYVTYLVALPLLVLMEPVTQHRLRKLLGHFVDAEIVPRERLKDLKRRVRAAITLRNSWIAEIAIFALVFIANYLVLQESVIRQETSWLGTAVDGTARFSLAGWWAVLVSGPLVGFLVVRWLWRYLIWANLVRQIAGLDLHIATSHPDKTGGLAFISQYPSAFSLFVLAMSTIVAAMLAKQLVYAGEPITAYKYAVIAWIVTMIVIHSLPLIAFSSPLSAAKQRAMLGYASLASREGYAKQEEWLDRDEDKQGAGPNPQEVEAPGDLKARYEAARGMRTIPFTKEAIVPISLAAAVPIAIAAATQLPFKQVLKLLKFLII